MCEIHLVNRVRTKAKMVNILMAIRSGKVGSSTHSMYDVDVS